MKKHIAIAVSAMVALAVAAPAIAADMPAPVYRKAPPPAAVAPTYNWTGCYVGGQIGGLWVRKEWTDVTNGASTPFGSHNADGWLAGGQVGCNYQTGQWVFGIQGDYAWTDAKGSNVNLALPLFTDFTQVKSLASVTGRIGYAFDRFLPYVKGGWAWERDNYSLNGQVLAGVVAVALVPVTATATETRGGWTVGVGGEYAFADNWTAFLEYDYYDFGRRTDAFVTTAGVAFGNISIDERKSVVKAGINFKFGGGGGPVVARY
jgi:outer membrane immunogenic protein